MASNWTTRAFGDCAVLVRDTVKPTDAAGARYVGLEHIAEGELRLGGVGAAEQVTSAKSRFRVGDILFGKLRPYFRKVIRARFEGVCSTDIWVVRPKQGIDPNFLFYWMASQDFVDAATRGSEGTKMPRAKWDFVSRLEQAIPPLPEQAGIGRIFSALDNKIELNARMNETLDAIVAAVFSSWFVKLDPVRAKAEGRDTGLPRRLAGLFPDAFVDSELGDIPEGWRVSPLGDQLAELETGGRPKGGVSEFKSGVPSIGAESIVRLGVFDFGKTKFVPREFFDGMSKGHVKSRDVLLYKDGGRPGEFEPHVTLVGDGFPFEECAINEHVYRLRAQDGVGQPLLFYWLSSDRVMEEMRIKGTGVAVPGLNSTQVKSLRMLVPPKPVAEAFDSIAEPAIARILGACRESRALAVLRDSLLPKLISGEVRLDNVEAILERVV